MAYDGTLSFNTELDTSNFEESVGGAQNAAIAARALVDELKRLEENANKKAPSRKHLRTVGLRWAA